MDPEVVKGLGQNGPWAAMAGLLLWQLLKDRSADRTLLVSLLTDFKAAIVNLESSIRELSAEQKALRAMLEEQRKL